MYQAHFGLDKGLFDSGIAQGASVFLGARQQAVIANAKVALSTLDSVLVLTGAAGVGKTTVASAALRESSTRLALGWLGGNPVNPSELLELLLVEFGLNPPRAGRMERLQLWRQFLNETNATDSRVFVIVERADDLNATLLRALDSFTAADPNGCAGANVVLLGEQALAEQLKSPALDSLRQRIRLRQKLEPLTLDELRAYLTQHVTIAGGGFDKMFAADALPAIHRYTGGSPRLVNNLCETALTLAAAGGAAQLTGEVVASAATGLLGLEEPPAETVQRAAAPVSVSQPPATTSVPPVSSASSASSASLAPAASSVPRPPIAPPSVGAATPARPAAPSEPSPASAQPVPRPAARVTYPSKAAFDGGETDIVADEILTDTLVDETPDIAMPELPVLTDAVEPPAQHARPARLHAAAPVTKAAAAPIRKPAAAPSSAKTVRPVAGAVAHAAPSKAAAHRPAPQTAATDTSEDSGTKTMRALAAAKSISDISNSMAETLFGEADLDMLSTALAASSWPDTDDDAAESAQPASTPADDNSDAFDLFDLGPDAPLELIDDSTLPPHAGGRKRVNDR